MTVREIAAWFGGEVVGNPETAVDSVAKIEEAQAGSISFLANPKYTRFLATTNASAVLISTSLDLQAVPSRTSLVLIRVENPYLAFLVVLKKFSPAPEPFGSGIHPSAVIDPKATLGANVSLGANAVVEQGARIGANSKLGAGVVIGKNAVVGDGCAIYSNATIYHECRVGNRVTIHSGAVIGSDGFGFVPLNDGTYEKTPQLGIVVVEDDVEIGANTCIDRATLGETKIGRGVKLDNLIHVAHNCTIGEHTVIAGATGMAGSTKIGAHCMIGGMVSINGHIEIADRTTILAVSFVTKSVKTPGTTLYGSPAAERHKALHAEAAIRLLPERVEELERRLLTLQQRLDRK